MASIHIGSVTLTNAGAAKPLSSTRIPVRQVFVQGTATFNLGDSTVTTTTGIQCSAAGAGAAVNAPHTPMLGNTSGPPIINLFELFAVSATPGVVINFLYIP